MKNSYWNNTGALQAEYDRIREAGHKYTMETERVFYSYYRYFNDGDLPGWARGRWDLTQQGYWGRELNPRGEEELERRVTARIEIELRRFEKANNPA